MNRTGRAVTLAAASDEWLAAFHCGWCDAVDANPWPRAYEAMTHRQQLAYEQGRLCIVAMRSAQIRIPPWDGSRSGCGLVQNAMQLVVRRSGMPMHVSDDRKPLTKPEPPAPRLY